MPEDGDFHFHIGDHVRMVGIIAEHYSGLVGEVVELIPSGPKQAVREYTVQIPGCGRRTFSEFLLQAAGRQQDHRI